MKRIVEIRVADDYRVWLRFDDGVAGEVDFSAHAGQGVFKAWNDPEFFRRAAIGDGGRTLAWPGELDFCADALWLRITGKRAEDLFPQTNQRRTVYAHP